MYAITSLRKDESGFYMDLGHYGVVSVDIDGGVHCWAKHLQRYPYIAPEHVETLTLNTDTRTERSVAMIHLWLAGVDVPIELGFYTPPMRSSAFQWLIQVARHIAARKNDRITQLG